MVNLQLDRDQIWCAETQGSIEAQTNGQSTVGDGPKLTYANFVEILNLKL